MPTWILFFLLLAAFLFAVKMIYIFSTAVVLPFTRGAVYVSTSRKKIDAFLDAVPMGKKEVLVDLGCGDGRVLRRAHRRYGVQAIGYEINALAFVRAVLQCLRYPAITIRQDDFFKADLSTADIIFCYLYPDVMAELASKLQAEVKADARVVSCHFPLTGFSPANVLHPENSSGTDPIYIYRLG